MNIETCYLILAITLSATVLILLVALIALYRATRANDKLRGRLTESVNMLALRKAFIDYTACHQSMTDLDDYQAVIKMALAEQRKTRSKA